MYPLPALLTPLLLIPFIIEEMTGCTNKAAKDANKTPRNPSSCVFISCFTVSVTSLVNIPDSSNDFIILIISVISSFGINKVNPIHSLTAPFPLIFLSNLFIAFKAKLLTNIGKLSLAKVMSMFVGAFFPRSPNQELKDPLDWIILGIWALLSFISVGIFIYNSCGSCSA